QQIRDHAQIMIDETVAMAKQWQPGQTVEICQAMMDLTMGITSQAFFGIDLRDRPEAKVIVRFIELFNERVSGIPVPGWLPLPATLEMKRYITDSRRLFNPLIDERRRNPQPYTDILAMLVQAQETDETGLITDAQVCNEVDEPVRGWLRSDSQFAGVCALPDSAASQCRNATAGRT
ncbi:MAG: hypothetical protein AAFQ61_10755, partial [Cyanobacteria bacterium J06626_23]